VLNDSIEIDKAATHFDASLQRGTLRWSDANGAQTLNLFIGEPGSVAVTFGEKGWRAPSGRSLLKRFFQNFLP
jgi:hypothetical protein